MQAFHLGRVAQEDKELNSEEKVARFKPYLALSQALDATLIRCSQ